MTTPPPIYTLFPYTTLFRSKIERDTTAYHFQKVTFYNCDFSVGGCEGNFHFAGSGFQRRIRCGERDRSASNKVFLQLPGLRSEEHTSELQSRQYLVCRLLLE